MKKLIGKSWVYSAVPLIVWFLLLVLPFLQGPANVPADVRHHFIQTVVRNNFTLLCLFYVHTYLIYPLITKKGIAWYVIALLITLGLYWTYWSLFANTPPPHHNDWPRPMPGDIAAGKRFGRHRGPDPFMAVSGPLIALLCSFCYRIILDNAARAERMRERETIHLKTELNFLRSQISPHFIFNILNSLVSLSRKKSDALEPAIMNLSHIMRYMLYESDDNRVPLNKEIEYVKSYINLQMLRFGSEVSVNIDINGDTDLFMIEPMLLIPFIENAFKHGTGMVDRPVINISLHISDESDQMNFCVQNPIGHLDQSKDGSSGIGLSNVQRRLAILYPQKHDLNINRTENSFGVELTLHLG